MSVLASWGCDRIFLSLRQKRYKRTRANASGNNLLVKSFQFSLNFNFLGKDRATLVAENARPRGLTL